MAIKKIHEEKNGVIGYVITKEEDLEKLPKNGIAITSRAILVNPTIGVKTYMFYDNDTDKNTDGEWIEWKAKYRGLGDNVKDFIKEYHEDLNKIVDVTNPKIGEGYDVTINGSEEGVLSFEVNGRTIQNLAPKIVESSYSSSSVSIGTVEMFKPSTLYTIMYEIKGSETLEIPSNKVESMFRLEALNSNSIMKTVYGYNGTITTTYVQVKETFTTTSDIAKINFNVRNAFNDYNLTEYTLYIKNLVVLEGDYTNMPIETLPFVEGIQSVGDLVEDESDVNFGKYKVEVKSVGKNLLNVSDLIFGKKIDDNGNIITNISTNAITNLIKVNPNTNYVYSIENISNVSNALNGSRVFLYDINENIVRKFWLATGNDKFLTDSNVCFLRISYFLSGGNADTTLDNLQTAQLEEGTTATPYEPYHEDIKTYYLDEPLRGLPNGVCDTIEKDKVVRKVGKVVLDGSESWELSDAKFTNSIRFRVLSIPFKQKSYGISNLFIYKEDTGVDYECFTLASDGAIHIRVLKSKLSTEDINGFKTWLQDNPTTVYYELAEPTEEQLPTVPMINSYNDVTHIYSTNYIQPFINIFDTVSIFKDANQYLNIECDRVFALPNMDDLEDNAVKEIHMYIYMKEEATLTFPSDIKWETLSEFGKGDYVEIILTYVKTNGVGQWLGNAIVYNG